MSKIKTLIPDDFEFEGDNNMSGLAQEQGELEQFQNSLEGRLVGVTTQELQDEIYRRVFEEFNGSLERLRDMLDRYVAPF